MDRLSNLILFSMIGSVGLTALSLASYSWEISPNIVEIKIASGFPFHFLVYTYLNSALQMLHTSIHTGYSVIIPALMADSAIWFLVSLAVLFVIRMIAHKTL
ncbi:MAG: hypothetical protein M0Z77_10370 [Thermoplasmatales archaeon]|nr:hypothetical protein [Candidatus Thermoplasmatota archaeon]MCL6003355.1 hypothetical protein [Candidatus Thermoplasmatota archaeon]MDA8056031.1 hypothetical protein [Thermoplasmatales archaeon]